MQSYMTNRTQSVAVRATVSECVDIQFGVPQGSVLGPVLYCLYSKPMGNICQHHDLSYMVYADDQQMYKVVQPQIPWTSTSMALEACVSDIITWTSTNMLKINQEKTEFITFTSRTSSLDSDNMQVQVGSSCVQAVKSVKNLGVHLDHTLTMEKQVNMVVKSCYFQIRRIAAIRQYITDDCCKTLVHALVTSRLDYGNGLLCGLPDTLTNRLQKVQNCAARLITRTGRREEMTPVREQLHWLPVRQRCQYKILMYTYKCLHDRAPPYLQELVVPYQPARSLRSESASLLCEPRTRTKIYGHRRFDSISARLWNGLPLRLRNTPSLDTFKKDLKTHLFKEAYVHF